MSQDLRTPAWLLEDPRAIRVRDTGTALLPAGGTADILRTPEDLALRALAPLLADAQDRAGLGLVLHDKSTGSVYWWLRPGSSASYPDGCRLLGANGWVAVPRLSNVRTALAWLHVPAAATVLTAAAWLASTLWDHDGTQAGAA